MTVCSCGYRLRSKRTKGRPMPAEMLRFGWLGAKILAGWIEGA